jgi:hypothetical protein
VENLDDPRLRAIRRQRPGSAKTGPSREARNCEAVDIPWRCMGVTDTGLEGSAP